jgi:ABC-type uncharacterized transport system substrate-binding protein
LNRLPCRCRSSRSLPQFTASPTLNARSRLWRRNPTAAFFFPPDITTFTLRDQVNAILARHRVPAIYADRRYVTSGGLVSYDADRTDIFRRTATYVDRVLRGEKPGDLPFQQPLKYQLTINLKTAKALGLIVPTTLLATADEVIE